MFETLRAALFLAGCGLVAVGISGLVALVMNLSAGRSFVGGETVFPDPAASVQETADDAVVLRVIAGWSGFCCCSATLPGAGTPCIRAARALLPSRSSPYQSI